MVTLFDRLYPGYTFTSFKDERMVTDEQIDLDLDCMVALDGFNDVPAVMLLYSQSLVLLSSDMHL
ncbi:hypothetical protein GCM10008959_05430 [Deinococcus seoulensis]|uniref:Uncharacterized protein n=1 Tax=Deinococcus seoulensis TaxID=1837379 RepID=A0ABQ2RMC6_9DEIO|nr:hypothetical protein GCM10008959_05430 [Deinococcus seoulensis]